MRRPRLTQEPAFLLFAGRGAEKRHDLAGAERAYREAVGRDARFAPAAQ